MMREIQNRAFKIRLNLIIVLLVKLNIIGEGGASNGVDTGMPHIAACIPVEKQELIATCINKGSNSPRNCTVNLSVGLDYQPYVQPNGNFRVYNQYENTGLTLECVKQELSELFGTELQASRLGPFNWNDLTAENDDGVIWNRATAGKHTFTLPPGVAVNIIQITGECLIFKVRTDRFLLISTNSAMKSRDVQHAKIDGIATTEGGKPCTPDFLAREPVEMLDLASKVTSTGGSTAAKSESNPVVLEEDDEFKPSYPYLHRDLSKWYKYGEDNHSIILEGPKDVDLEANIPVNAHLAWGEWKFCPAGSFVSGYYHSAAVAEEGAGNATKSDAFGIADVAVRCSYLNKGNDTVVVQHAPGRIAQEFPEDKLVSCGQDGIAVGFQLSSKEFQQFDDDVSIDNIRLICSSGVEIAPDVSKMDPIWKLRGNWTEPQLCMPKQALCGLRIKALPITWPTSNLRAYDNIGITNIQFQCCDVPPPGLDCNPVEKLDPVADCDNSLSETPKTCDIDIFAGLKYDSREELLRQGHLYESLGYSLNCIGEELSKTFAKALQFSRLGKFSWVMITSEKPDGKFWRKGISRKISINVQAFTRVEIFQIYGQCGFYHIHTSKFTSILQHSQVETVSDDTLTIDIMNPGSSQPWPSQCWETGKSITARDWISSLTTPTLKCPARNSFTSPTAHFPFKPTDGTNRTGVILQLPSHPLSFTQWGDLGMCPDGSYIRGWSDMLMEHKGDAMGVVLISTLCQEPAADQGKSYEILHIQPGFENKSKTWRDTGYLNTLNCIGAGIGVEGRAQLDPKQHKDKVGFWDTKLICSCGRGSGYSTVKRSESVRYDNVDPEVCKPRQAICGLQAAFGTNSATMLEGKHDGSGITNIKAICCNVPSPLQSCQLHEKEVLAATCDNFGSAHKRICHLNLTVGIVYQYETQEAKSYFYDSNGYPPSCLGQEIRRKAIQEGVSCGENRSCSFQWKLGKPQLWQPKTIIPNTLVIEPFAKINVYQVVAECGAVLVMSNYYVRGLTRYQDIELRKPFYIRQLPPIPKNSTRCEFS